MKQDNTWMIPESIKDRLAFIAAEFKVKTGASFEDINKFMKDTIEIYDDYMNDAVNSTKQ